MNEHPVLFNGPMVRAILENRKWVTRRPIKPQPPEGWNWRGWIQDSTDRTIKKGSASWAKEETSSVVTTGLHTVSCPFGEIGDLLWVRETWMEDYHPMTLALYHPPRFLYKASCDEPVYLCDGDGCILYRKDGYPRSPWSPSIHMPKKAARIWLRIVDIQVKRLWEIAPRDIEAEGFESNKRTWEERIADLMKQFIDAWNMMYNAWRFNPWVWVIMFERIERASE